MDVLRRPERSAPTFRLRSISFGGQTIVFLREAGQEAAENADHAYAKQPRIARQPAPSLPQAGMARMKTEEPIREIRVIRGEWIV